jgi:predicted nucleic-acid-binding protein
LVFTSWFNSSSGSSSGLCGGRKYRLSRKTIRELVEATLNTPEPKCSPDHVFRQAFITYETQNTKFANAAMGHYGLQEGPSTIYTYDEKHFKKISALKARKLYPAFI